MHKDAHNFQLPQNSCLIDEAAETALRHFLVAAIVGMKLPLKLVRTVPSHTPATEDKPAIHRLAVVFESEQEGTAADAIDLATRAVALSATMPAQRFIERMAENTAAAKSTARSTAAGAVFNLAPDPGVDLAAGPDRTATITLSIDPDGTRRVIEDPTAPGADPIDENETDL